MNTSSLHRSVSLPSKEIFPNPSKSIEEFVTQKRKKDQNDRIAYIKRNGIQKHKQSKTKVNSRKLRDVSLKCNENGKVAKFPHTQQDVESIILLEDNMRSEHIISNACVERSTPNDQHLSNEYKERRNPQKNACVKSRICAHIDHDLDNENNNQICNQPDNIDLNVQEENEIKSICQICLNSSNNLSGPPCSTCEIIVCKLCMYAYLVDQPLINLCACLGNCGSTLSPVFIKQFFASLEDVEPHSSNWTVETPVYSEYLQSEHGDVCQICFDPYERLLPPCKTCSILVCQSCFVQYLQVKIMDGEVGPSKLVCPGACQKRIPRPTIKRLLPSSMFDKYIYFLETKELGVRFCPAPDCGAKINERLFTFTRKVSCSSCNRISCMRCAQPYHALPRGECSRLEKRYRGWRRKHNVKNCPNCKWEIEKSGGCSHMVCSRCNYEFCWRCFSSWNDHDEWICIPKSLYHSKHKYFGRTVPVRIITKTVVAGVSVGLFTAGAGVAAVVIPPYLAFQIIKDSIHSPRNSSRHL